MRNRASKEKAFKLKRLRSLEDKKVGMRNGLFHDPIYERECIPNGACVRVLPRKSSSLIEGVSRSISISAPARKRIVCHCPLEAFVELLASKIWTNRGHMIWKLLEELQKALLPKAADVHVKSVRAEAECK
jgi:hypothetical protein